MKPKALTVSYLRVSTATQRENETIETQRFALARYFEQHAIKPDRQFEDDGISGSVAIHQRPQGSELYRLVSEGQVDRIFVFALDRVGRDTIDSLLFLRLAENHGAQLIGISDGTDTNREGSALELEIRTVLATQYRRDRVRQSKAGLRRRAAEGKLSTRPPFGFALDNDGRLMIDETKAEVMRFAFRSMAQGVNTKRIVAQLNEKLIPSPAGGRWRHDTLIYLLKHRAYMGEYRCFTTPKRNPHGGPRIPRDPKDAIAVPCPAIVTRELFEAVQERISFNGRFANGGKNFYLLRSLLRCGLCGMVYVGHTVSGRKYRDRVYPNVRYYECGTCTNRDYQFCGNVRVRADKIERVVWGEIESFILTPSKAVDQLLSRYNRQALANQKHAARDLEKMKDAQRKNRKARERLTMAVANGVVSDEDARAGFEQLSAEAARLDDAAATMEKALQGQSAQREHVASTRDILRQLKKRLEGGLSQEKRAELARRLIKRAVVGRQENGTTAVAVEYVFANPFCFAPVGLGLSASSLK